MGVQRYLGGTSVQHDKPIHQPGTLRKHVGSSELGSIVLNALDLDGKVINLCDHVVYTTRNRNFLWLISSRNWNLLCNTPHGAHCGCPTETCFQQLRLSFCFLGQT
ncbi:hypothetical protein EMCRGX_G034502 [Ephydatia muelleri]